ncbi:hypothetical protein OSF83_001759 [Enterococcus hirae]|uniref:hypothetical protein n=1 Tax=Enterococcus TaxID=1350 RepID=UPI0009C11C3E|nr:hypothetical protein [Enterococcus hirae]EMF0051985.1 hypothetical protein [Enterococcus hirae]EMF0083065.1 hypothetical protein [Enterococcus hirae]EMF0093888.1 hypothetical protein [Enterococcus hirae]EMF0097533.1 hypothetical protein [Enterococcus hirae]EMF0100514.1 hypothetical protein [Enterococcus hirae]
MYTIPIFIISTGILFMGAAIYLFLINYKRVIIGEENKTILYLNTLILVISISLILLGVGYFFVVAKQL